MTTNQRIDSVQQFDYYGAAPELGLHGRWRPEIRMLGLEQILGECSGRTVLDLGAAEGLIAYRFLQAGAALVHGFDIVLDRVMAARRICEGFTNTAFWRANLSDWESFRAEHASNLLDRYDIVLFLGLYHHLPIGRSATLEGAARMSADIFLLRTPDVYYGEERIAETLGNNGFRLSEEHRNQACTELSPLRVFRRW